MIKAIANALRLPRGGCELAYHLESLKKQGEKLHPVTFNIRTILLLDIGLRRALGGRDADATETLRRCLSGCVAEFDRILEAISPGFTEAVSGIHRIKEDDRA